MKTGKIVAVTLNGENVSDRATIKGRRRGRKIKVGGEVRATDGAIVVTVGEQIVGGARASAMAITGKIQ